MSATETERPDVATATVVPDDPPEPSLTPGPEET